MTEPKEIIQAAAYVIIEPVLQLLQADPHQWSTRPCQTCQTITSIIGKPFGCYLLRQQQGK